MKKADPRNHGAENPGSAGDIYENCTLLCTVEMNRPGLAELRPKPASAEHEVDKRTKKADPRGSESPDRLTQRLQTNVAHPSTAHKKDRPWGHYEHQDRPIVSSVKV